MLSRVITIYAPVIYTAPCIMFWMGAYTLRGEVGGGWALEFPSFLGPVKWEQPIGEFHLISLTGTLASILQNMGSAEIVGKTGENAS